MYEEIGVGCSDADDDVNDGDGGGDDDGGLVNRSR